MQEDSEITEPKKHIALFTLWATDMHTHNHKPYC